MKTCFRIQPVVLPEPTQSEWWRGYTRHKSPAEPVCADDSVIWTSCLFTRIKKVLHTQTQLSVTGRYLRCILILNSWKINSQYHCLEKHLPVFLKVCSSLTWSWSNDRTDHYLKMTVPPYLWFFEYLTVHGTDGHTVKYFIQIKRTWIWILEYLNTWLLLQWLCCHTVWKRAHDTEWPEWHWLLAGGPPLQAHQQY